MVLVRGCLARIPHVLSLWLRMPLPSAGAAALCGRWAMMGLLQPDKSVLAAPLLQLVRCAVRSARPRARESHKVVWSGSHRPGIILYYSNIIIGRYHLFCINLFICLL